MGVTTFFKDFSLGDIVAGLSVTCVVIPQSLAYAELAGMPAYTGLLAAGLPSIAAALFASSPYLQTGPVALTSLLSFGVLSQLATPGTSDYIGLAAALALFVGVFRVLFGLFRFGPMTYLISQPVLRGFTSATALLVLASQLPKVLGVEREGQGLILEAIYSLRHPQDWVWSAILIGAISIAILILGKRLHKLFPGIIVVSVLGLLVTTFTPYRGAIVGERLSLESPGVIWAVPWTALPSLTLGAFVIAIVGFTGPAFIARRYAAMDKIPWHANREFMSQGVANIMAGLVGSFPVAGAFSRTSINRLAGATSRVSGLITGCCVLAFMPFSYILAGLPKAVLGAIVMAGVLSSVDLKGLWQFYRYSKPQAYIAWFTLGACLVLAPRIHIAILLGIGVTVIHHLRREQKVMIDSFFDDSTIFIQPKGVLWFGSIANFENEFQSLLTRYEEADQISLNLKGLGRIDLSAAMSLQNLIKTSQEAGFKVTLNDIPPMATAWSSRLWQKELNRLS